MSEKSQARKRRGDPCRLFRATVSHLRTLWRKKGGKKEGGITSDRGCIGRASPPMTTLLPNTGENTPRIQVKL